MSKTIDNLRQRNRKLRAELGDLAQQKASVALCKRVVALDEFRLSQRIGAYYAVNGEINLKPLIDLALAEGKEIYLPNLDQQTLRFSPYDHAQKMRINRYRLPEPDVSDEKMLEPSELDLVLAPLVVFDQTGNRIGMGGGYYDRSFEFRLKPGNSTPRLIGVAHELQKVDQLLPEAWDVPLDAVITDSASYF